MNIQSITAIFSVVIAALALGFSYKASVESDASETTLLKRDVKELKEHSHNFPVAKGDKGDPGERATWTAR